jgi:hypothetical protein
MKPSIGRIVHYFPIYGGDSLPAIIVSVDPTSNGQVVNLQVFSNQDAPNVFSAWDIPLRSHAEEDHCWDWPPRVE